VIRTQVQLTEKQSRMLNEEARRAGVSVAELVRRSVDQFLGQTGSGTGVASDRSSMLEVVGCFDSGLSDVSTRHDHYLNQAYSSSGL
jgi:hypothetical protein